mmetsp:Transcript_20425/g.33337  ORF Transcript_20425/g.33337 Transcript_20425/m.33337 type:complete len:88 (-) Transcript_20425:320-583(-)
MNNKSVSLHSWRRKAFFHKLSFGKAKPPLTWLVILFKNLLHHSQSSLLPDLQEVVPHGVFLSSVGWFCEHCIQRELGFSWYWEINQT